MRIAALITAFVLFPLIATADEAKPAPAEPACRAFDGAKEIAKATGPKAPDCSFNLREDVKKHFCKAGSKGKTFKFVVKYEHKLGERAWPESKDSMYCATEL